LTTVMLPVIAGLIIAFGGWAIAAAAAAAATLVAALPVIALGLAVAGLALLIIRNWDWIKAKTADLWNNVRSIFGNMVNWFRGFPDMIRNALSGLKDALMRPFNDAWNAIKNIADKIKNELNKLNPFAKFSPSLVDQVTKGVSVIQDEFSKLDSMNMPIVAHEMGGFAGSSSQNININVDTINERSDLDMIGRELGLRARLI
jgi:archaellum component FlaC